MRISDWSSDVCSSDLPNDAALDADGSDTLDIQVDANADSGPTGVGGVDDGDSDDLSVTIDDISDDDASGSFQAGESGTITVTATFDDYLDGSETHEFTVTAPDGFTIRSEEHTSELQPL